MPSTPPRLPSQLLASRDGSAAVEFALLAPMLILILVGLADVSQLISQTMQVRAAAQAGADWAQRHGWDQTRVQAAVTTATTLKSVAATPAPTRMRACVSGGQITETTAANCAPGVAAGEFVNVAATAPFKGLLPWPGIVLPKTLSATALVRVQ
jgi:Flp pilus assembly protein TadG